MQFKHRCPLGVAITRGNFSSLPRHGVNIVQSAGAEVDFMSPCMREEWCRAALVRINLILSGLPASRWQQGSPGTNRGATLISCVSIISERPHWPHNPVVFRSTPLSAEKRKVES